MRNSYDNITLIRTIKHYVKVQGYNAMEAASAVGKAAGFNAKQRQELFSQYMDMPKEFFNEDN